MHKDCVYYTSIDVFKGYCRKFKENRMADENKCKNFKSVKKCKFCQNYTSKEEHLGLCMEKVSAYPDMIAKTCDDFQ